MKQLNILKKCKKQVIIAAGSVNWYNHFGKQLGNFPKSKTHTYHMI